MQKARAHKSRPGPVVRKRTDQRDKQYGDEQPHRSASGRTTVLAEHLTATAAVAAHVPLESSRGRPDAAPVRAGNHGGVGP